jgi:hypothetical protein
MGHTYREGQRWSYRTRPEEKASSLTILRVEEHPVLGTIVHVSLRGLRVKAAAHPQGYTDEVRHMPFSREAIDRSVLKVVEDPAPLPEFEEAYDSWKAEIDQGAGGIWTIVVADAVGVIERALDS